MAPRSSARLKALSENTLLPPPSQSAAKSKSVGQGRKRKTPADGEDAAPETPKKRSRKAVLKKPPQTPTPAAISLMSVPYSSGDVDDATPPPPVDRVANPLTTNAPLVSPETKRLVHNAAIEDLSPTKASKNKTTKTILEDAVAHLLSVDPRLKPVIEKHHCRVFSEEGLAEEIDPFRSLASGIISQQVSGAAAKSIKTKFISLFNSTGTFPTPSQVASADITHLRTAGLSQRKAEYIQGLAAKFVSGELTSEMLFTASYDEVLEKLTAVRGLGKWSVEMFACFGLKRMDVFSTGDLGVQRGMAAFVGRDVGKLKAKGSKDKWKYMSEKDMLEIAAKFAPYRSVFMWYMWRVEDVDLSTFES